MGAAWGPYGDYFFVTAGNDNKVYRYGFQNDSAWFLNSIKLAEEAPAAFVSPTGLAINSEGDKIYTVSKMPVPQYPTLPDGIARTKSPLFPYQSVAVNR